ncbi:MAG: polyphosphate polymerase domain-containing protein, partial [Flavobacteriales bacterium]|nr:polyphosphate polymerase domain-containing protein [Flavobacteriales bacterium]
MGKIKSRQEYKFLVSKKEQMDIEVFSKNSIKELFPEREILSLYMDTNNFELYKQSTLNDVEKFKVRYRTYPNTDLNIYEEIKLNSKLGKEKLVNKTEFNDFESIAPNYKKGYFLFPTLFVQYKRKYFELENSVRITIDSNISYSLP